MPRCQIDHIRVYCTDLTASRHFYRDMLGLAELDSSDHLGYAMLDAGPCRLILQRVRSQTDLTGRITGISLSSEDVLSVYNEWSMAGVNFEGEPKKTFWGGRSVNFFDPDKNRLTLAGP